MAKFHINGNGEVGKCKVGSNPFAKSNRGCPFGGEEQHYDSAEEARIAYEKKMEDKIVLGSLQKDGTRRHPLADIPDLGTRENSEAVRLTMEAVDAVSEETLERWRGLSQNAPEYRIAKNIDDYRAGSYTEGVLTNLASNSGTVAYAYAEKDLKALAKEKAEIEAAEEINALHDRITNRNREILADSGVDTYDGFSVNNFGLEKVEVDPARKAAIEGEMNRISQDIPVLKKLHKAWSAPAAPIDS